MTDITNDNRNLYCSLQNCHQHLNSQYSYAMYLYWLIIFMKFNIYTNIQKWHKRLIEPESDLHHSEMQYPRCILSHYWVEKGSQVLCIEKCHLNERTEALEENTCSKGKKKMKMDTKIQKAQLNMLSNIASMFALGLKHFWLFFPCANPKTHNRSK